MGNKSEQQPNIATRIIWNVRPVAPFAALAILVLMYLAVSYLPAELVTQVQWAFGVLSTLVFLTIPLSVVVEPDLSSWWYRREVEKNRARLAGLGLTPEQYLARIPASDALARAKAKADLDID